MSYPTVLSFSGKIGSGKDYIIDNIVVPFLRKNGKIVHTISFADYLKIMCNVKDGIHYNRLFYNKDIVSRTTLQSRGNIERTNDINFFVKIVDCLLKLEKDRGTEIVIVRDLRYKNELEFLESISSFTFRINAPKRTKDKLLLECEGDSSKADIISSHKSEVDLDDYRNFSYTIYNDYENETNVVSEVEEMLSNIK